MKTTLELPDDLMRAVKIRAAATDRKLKDMVEELIRRGLEGSPEQPMEDPLQALKKKLIFHPDGTITNPLGIDDPGFFEALDQIREENHRTNARDSLADIEAAIADERYVRFRSLADLDEYMDELRQDRHVDG